MFRKCVNNLYFNTYCSLGRYCWGQFTFRLSLFLRTENKDKKTMPCYYYTPLCDCFFAFENYFVFLSLDLALLIDFKNLLFPIPDLIKCVTGCVLPCFFRDRWNLPLRFTELIRQVPVILWHNLPNLFRTNLVESYFSGFWSIYTNEVRVS